MGMKLTILGETHSGKTCYLLGMQRRMSSGIKEHSLTTLREDDKTRLAQMYKNLTDTAIGKERFPEPSNKVEIYHFGLNIGTYRAMDFEWVDYPGEYVDPAYSHAGKEGYEMVKRSIGESSALFICLDGANLVEGDTDDKIFEVQNNSAVYTMPFITDLFGEYQEQNKKLPPIGIIVTKWDLCMETTTEAQLKEIVEEVFSPLFNSNDTVVSVIPVSLGKNISDDSYKGKIKPINIQLPILYGIRYALQDSIKEYEDNKQKNADSSDDYISQRKQDISSKKADIKRWETFIDDAESDISVWKETKRSEIEDSIIYVDWDVVRDCEKKIAAAESDIAYRRNWISQAKDEIDFAEKQISSEETEHRRTTDTLNNRIQKKRDAISNLLVAMKGINLTFSRGKWQAGVE